MVDLKQASVIIITITLTKTSLAGVLVSYVPIPPCIHLLPFLEMNKTQTITTDCGDLQHGWQSVSSLASMMLRFVHIHLPGTVELLPW